ncbi:MAG: bifunctional DNA-formamidopyrimidine glycosylase/DNA-(apurinic or apyrimidinic site) lyase [Anaerovoracaceae bacterium]|jgi:formamidopyrimidine-DNA glycosylase
MPELPEVETIKNVIGPQIEGRIIEGITVARPEVIAHPAADVFCRAVSGQKISSMDRRGKFLSIHLGNDSRIIMHMRMTGCLLAAPPDYPQEKHTHIIMQLSDGMELRFSDTRRFGRFWLIRSGEEDVYSGIAKLGVEPLSAECSAGYLQKRLGKSRKAVKECLLDQSVVAGIGNIYSDEILFEAGIIPMRPAKSLTAEEWQRLAAAIHDSLSYFISKNRVEPQAYLETKGKDYRNTPFLQVYGHGGEPCPKCGGTLSRSVIRGRSSVYCTHCQL